MKMIWRQHGLGVLAGILGLVLSLPATAEAASIRDSFDALTQQDLDDFHFSTARWVEAFIDPFHQQWPAHAQLEGYFAGDPADPEHAPTFFTLRIPEGWETNGRVIFEQPAGLGDHTQVLVSTDDYLRDGQSHVVVNTFDLRKLLLSPNSLEDFSRRMNQAVHRLKAFLQARFGEVTYTYATGYSRGGLVLLLACEREGTPFDGLFAWEGAGDWQQLGILIPHALRTGKTLADHPALERPLGAFSLLFLTQNFELILREVDPEYLASGGALANYEITSRPPNVQRYWSSRKLSTTGQIATKAILFWGLNDELTASKLGIDYFLQVLARSRQADVRLYLGKSYPHTQLPGLGQDQLNGMKLLQSWVEAGIEPGALRTVLDGDIGSSRAMGYEDDPLGYALAINGS